MTWAVEKEKERGGTLLSDHKILSEAERLCENLEQVQEEGKDRVPAQLIIQKLTIHEVALGVLLGLTYFGGLAAGIVAGVLWALAQIQ